MESQVGRGGTVGVEVEVTVGDVEEVRRTPESNAEEVVGVGTTSAVVTKGAFAIGR
jgi:hypothetical protein